MAQRKLKVIPETETKNRSVTDYRGEGTIAMQSEGNSDLLCGQCGAVLVKGAGAQIHGIVFRCNGCGAYNDSE